MYLRIQCAWCGMFMGIKECEGSIDKAYKISHGICPECKARVEMELKDLFKTTSEKCKMKGGE